MSNKDINKQDAPKNKSETDISLKDNMHLFSFSLLKSKSKMTLKQHSNSFRFDFTKDNNESYINKKMKTNNEINNRKISLIDGDKNSSLKTLNIEVPSSERLSNERFKTDFLNEYENSFAYYCGINKKQFNDIYIKNRYIPILNEFGDIKISIKYIVDLLKTYSVNVRAGRKILKRNRIKKIFKTQKKKLFYEKNKKNRLLFEVKKDEGIKALNISNISEQSKNINDLKKIDIKNVKQMDNNKNTHLNNDIKKENNNNINNSGFGLNKIKTRILLNRGNISIPKSNNLNLQLIKTPIVPTSSIGFQHITSSNISIANNNYFNNINTLSNEGNKQFISNNINNNNPTTSFRMNLTNIQPMTDSKQNLSPSNNNIFNFNLNYINPVPPQTNINNNILSNNTNINYNSKIGNQILSTPNALLSQNGNFLLSPFSPIIINSNLSTPRIISPVLSINNNIFTDTFNFNNNQNSFMFGNNNNTTYINNNMNINNNIINNPNNNNVNENKNYNIIGNNNIKNNIINNSINNNINDNKNNNLIFNNNMNNNMLNNINNNNNINFIGNK